MVIILIVHNCDPKYLAKFKIVKNLLDGANEFLLQILTLKATTLKKISTYYGNIFSLVQIEFNIFIVFSLKIIDFENSKQDFCKCS